ncbi:DNA-processing protein DprA [Arthrobacter sp. KK5.5]|uniref:DNA-processing protein DprA n=1 Tax=Arthrobacter sp. KK5.5 TaxID=3373084 RepID=UPI003EE6F0F1
MRAEDTALVALLRSRPQDLKWPELTARVLECGSAIQVWNESVPPSLIPSPTEEAALDEAAVQLEEWDRSGLRFVSVLSRDFPARLRDIHQVPPFLFAQGGLRAQDIGVSIVGSRKASERALEIASTVATSAVKAGLTVIAGLADGIDTAAHRSALSAGGRTVAFIGTGLNVSYPAKNRSLQKEIAERGLVLSQFWPNAPVQKHNFLMRNALMSGYGIATVVIEAGELSGTRAQARMAVEHGRPVILTDVVVKSTSWGKQLQGLPGVHVATGVEHIGDIVQSLVAEDQKINQSFRPLVLA